MRYIQLLMGDNQLIQFIGRFSRGIHEGEFIQRIYVIHSVNIEG